METCRIWILLLSGPLLMRIKNWMTQMMVRFCGPTCFHLIIWIFLFLTSDTTQTSFVVPPLLDSCCIFQSYFGTDVPVSCTAAYFADAGNEHLYHSSFTSQTARDITTCLPPEGRHIYPIYHIYITFMEGPLLSSSAWKYLIQLFFAFCLQLK